MTSDTVLHPMNASLWERLSRNPCRQFMTAEESWLAALAKNLVARPLLGRNGFPLDDALLRSGTLMVSIKGDEKEEG